MKLIDLRLPSGTKWAACNIGAEKPTEFGDYFAWGDTSAKTIMSEEPVRLTIWTSIP